MDLERRRSSRVVVDRDGSSGVVKAAIPVAVSDISAGGLRLRLASSLEPGGVYALTALLRGLSLATSIRVTRCRPGVTGAGAGGERAGPWEAGAEFLWRDDADAAAVRSWLDGRAPRST